MSSIMTNASAMTALKSLQMTNKALESTQARISTGFRVAQASDNAAYWSIATTMRSDNKAMGTVQDALGLGAAQVDVAYTAMEATKDVLDNIKTKLVAASQPGVDKAKIQSEITQLQSQLEGIASAASFSGSNWLQVDSSASSYNATEKVVSSFTRGSDGNVSISTIDVAMAGTALFDSSTTAGGLLEGTAGTATSAAAFAWTQGEATDGDSIALTIEVNGEAQTVSVTIADAANFSIDNLIEGLNAGLEGAFASKDDSGNLVLTSHTLGSSSTIALTGVAFTDNDTSGAITTSSIGFTTIAVGTGSDEGGGVLGIDISDASAAQIDAYIAQVDTMAASVTTAASDLGAVKSRISMQKDFVTNLMSAVERGVGALVDADMNQESTRLQALQVQQQLGIQALSIANGNAQQILSLFR
jgi:flagellin